MKFKDFLASCEDYEGEVFSKELEESGYSFSWNKDQVVTPAGSEKFNKIFNSDILIHKTSIELLDKKITQAEFDFFMRAVAGYIHKNDYEAWFGKL